MLYIRFDGPPSHESGRFIEIERDGKGIAFGTWVEEGKGGDWLLLIPDPIDIIEENDLMSGALAAIIGYTYKMEDSVSIWVQHVALSAFGCETFDEYLEKISTGLIDEYRKEIEDAMV